MPDSAIVTGGAGFIGSHVVESLLAQSTSVVVVDDLSTGDERRVDPRADLMVIDITDAEGLKRVFSAVQPAAVYHLAAQSSVTVSVTDPQRDCAVNVGGTLNVLEAAGQCDAPVVFTSTGGALYGNDAPIPTDEGRIPAPLAPYGASKWAGEAYVRTWARSSGIPHAVCRLGNVYGPRQSPHGEAGVVSIFSYKLWRGERPTLFGEGAPTRDYVHVTDVAAALIKATGSGDVFNVATGRETRTSAVLDELQAAAGTSLEPVLAPLRRGELDRSCMSPERAWRKLGWRAELPLAEGLRETYRTLVQEFEREPITAGEGPAGGSPAGV